MPNEEPRLKKPRNNENNSSFIILSNEPLPEDEFDAPQISPDFWGVHAERFRKGLTTEKIIIEHPKQTYTLNKGEHYFVIEDVKRRSVACITCPIRHGGILDAKELLMYEVKDGVLYYKGKALNQIPDKSVVDKAMKTV